MSSMNVMLQELEQYTKNSSNLDSLLESINGYLEIQPINEVEYDKVTSHLKLDLLDVDYFIKQNDCKEVSDPRAFARDDIPSDKGLLSNSIFGITQEERAGTFAYIDLHGTFLDPSCYKAWFKIDKNIRSIVHGIGTWRVNDRGEIVEDPKGKTGIKFLIDNINKIKFKSTDSLKRDIRVKYLERNKDKLFITKYLVIPAFYRDKNTGGRRSRVVGLGGINKLYTDLMVSAQALTATQDFMFDATDAMNGRVQEIILNIYDWFCGNTNANINESDLGTGISGKRGILRRAAMSKTSNFSSRLVLTAAELKVETPKDFKVNFDKSALPLASAITEFRDFVMFHVKRFFDNEFMGTEYYPVINNKGELKQFTPKDPEIQFSDERIKEEMERFLHGYNNRFIPVEIALEETKDIYYMQFKGRYTEGENTSPESIYHRPLTWCDVFFIACSEAVKDKHIMITRFPIDSYLNQIYTRIELSSTKETEPMYFDNKFYRYYPKIRTEDLFTDTSNKFVDTMNLSNLYAPGLGADFDGDTVTSRGVYTDEANEEIETYMHSKANFIDFGCKPSRTSTGDVIQSMYAMTKILSDTKVTSNIQFS